MDFELNGLIFVFLTLGLLSKYHFLLKAWLETPIYRIGLPGCMNFVKTILRCGALLGTTFGPLLRNFVFEYCSNNSQNVMKVDSLISFGILSCTSSSFLVIKSSTYNLHSRYASIMKVLANRLISILKINCTSLESTLIPE
jgi:hypothetical protein